MVRKHAHSAHAFDCFERVIVNSCAVAVVIGVLGTEHWLEHELFSSSSKRSRNFDAFCAALEGELAKKGRCVMFSADLR